MKIPARGLHAVSVAHRAAALVHALMLATLIGCDAPVAEAPPETAC